MPECLRFDLVGESEEVVCGAAKLEAGLAQEVCTWRSQPHLPVAHGLVRHADGGTEINLLDAAMLPSSSETLADEFLLRHDGPPLPERSRVASWTHKKIQFSL